jgi:hypothetical protein
MSISYRTPGAWGAGLSRDLHPGEVDQNFYELKGFIDSILASMPGTTVSIIDITQTGDNLYVHLTDGSILGPFKLPVVHMVFRGEWLPETAYYVSDVVTFNGAVYLVLASHTSNTTFDPAANDGAGHDYYGLFLSYPGNVLPEGGAAGQTLAKASNVDFEVAWMSTGTPPGGTADAVLTKLSDTDYDSAWVVPAVVHGVPAGGSVDATLTKLSSANYDVGWVVRGKSAAVNVSDYTLVLSDFYKWLRCTNAVGCVITIPTNSAVGFAIDTEITIRSVTSGAVSIVGAAGVTLNVPTGFIATLLDNGSTALIKKVATDTWDLVGLLAPD